MQCLIVTLALAIIVVEFVESAASERGCSILTMKDSWGDGWNGASWSWLAGDSTILQTGTLLLGSSRTENLCYDGEFDTHGRTPSAHV